MESSNYAHELDAAFWESRWVNGQTGWDIGAASPPLTEFMKTIQNKNVRILIPGCGNAHEASFLLDAGFTNITLVDISSEAVRLLREKFLNYPEISIKCADFYELNGEFDVILEQTFFCAQVIERRTEYVQKMAQLLAPKGILVGVLFGIEFPKEGPPFGGSVEKYRQLFEGSFTIHKLEPCRNSIKPRLGSELFIHFEKKGN